VLAAARAVEASAHKQMGIADGPRWLARQSGSTPGQARQALDTIKSLPDLPDTKAALLAGDISLAQAAEIVHAEADTPGAELVLLPTARAGDLSKVKDHARDHRQSHTPVEDLHRQQLAATEFRHWADRLGMVRFAGALPPEWGLPLVRRVERQALRIRRAARQPAQVEHADSQVDPADPADRRARQPVWPFPFYQAQALAELVTGGGDDDEPHTHRSVDLVVVCDINAWRRGHTHPGEVCHIIEGGPIPVDLAKELSQDAFLKALLHTGTNIHTVKHFGRNIPEVLRTALDLGPVPEFTGRVCADCGGRHGLQYDHVDPVAHNGPTEYTNLQPSCWSDHAEKTERDRQAGLLGSKAKAQPPARSP
jgi:hypothetical protein